MTEKINRLEYLDALRGFAILCVVAGHSGGLSDNIQKIISVFMLPVFFVISGFLMDYRDSVSLPFKSFAKKRFIGIMIPYFAFSILLFLFEILVGVTHHSLDWMTVLPGVVLTLILFGKSVLWFLPALFLAEILFFLIGKLLSGSLSKVHFEESSQSSTKGSFNTAWISVVTFSIGIAAALLSDLLNTTDYIFAMEASNRMDYLSIPILLAHTTLRILYLLPFLSSGYVFSKLHKNKGIPKKWRIRIPCIIASAVVLVATCFITLLFSSVVDVRILRADSLPLAIVFGILSSCALLLLFQNAPEIPMLNDILVLCGRHSLIIMATHFHYNIMYYAIEYAKFRSRPDGLIQNILYVARVFIVVTAFEVPIIYLIEKYAPFLAGKGFSICKKKN